MPRYPTHEKTVHGKPVTQTEFTNTICEAIRRKTMARVGDLIEVVGSEWDTPDNRKLLGQTLSNLTVRKKLKRVEGERGAYAVTDHYKRTGSDLFDQDENAILKIIRSHGGFCRFRDIQEGMDVRPHGSRQDRLDIQAETAYRRIYAIIEGSTRIRQDITSAGYGEGIYNVPWAEMKGLPFVGRYASHYIKYTFDKVLRANTGIETSKDEWYDEQERFFEQVGAAFQRLRTIQKLSLEEFLAIRSIRAAVLTFKQRAVKPLAVIRGEWKARMDVEAARLRESILTREDGRPQYAKEDEARRAVDAYQDEQQQLYEQKSHQWLYRKFENGDVGAHCNAPVILYTAIAEHFEVCAAELSRGAIFALPYEERLRPGRARRSALDLGEIEGANEAAVSATREAVDLETADLAD
jgi:hypothetical protein